MQQQQSQEATKSSKSSKQVTQNSATDAVNFLKKQHREVEDLFQKIENAGERATKTKESLFEEIAEKLTLHTKIEETIFYPAAVEADEDLVKEAFEEHDNVKAMIRKLQRVGGNDDTFDAKITVLKELVKHHVKEEEEELFPKCEKALGEETLNALGEKMRNKYTALESSH